MTSDLTVIGFSEADDAAYSAMIYQAKGDCVHEYSNSMQKWAWNGSFVPRVDHLFTG